MSLRCGMLLKVNLSLKRIELANIGKAEFFAPEAVTEPLSLYPPSISNLSMLKNF